MYRVSPSLPRFARALLGGAVAATVWVNLSPASYYDAMEWRILDMELPAWILPHPASLTPRSVVLDGLMALFVFFIGKEFWETLRLERGALHGRPGILPMALTAGGMAGAALVWTLSAFLVETAEEAGFGTGWQVPLGADLVLCFLIGQRVFGPGHPALHLLLLIGIATDLLALLLFGLTRPLSDLRLVWLLLPVGACLFAWIHYGRAAGPDASERGRRTRLSLWPYLVAGVLSWIGTAASGLPPALGLLPVIPAIAHGDRSFGAFAEVEEVLHDPLNRLARLLVRPLEPILFGFGLVAGGVELAAFAPTTIVTLASLWLGRPLGMLLFGVGLASLLGLRLPTGVSLRNLLVLAGITALGFTVPILVLGTGLPGGAMQEGARLGLAISLLPGPLLILLCRPLQRPNLR